jgi:hypothetical protein
MMWRLDTNLEVTQLSVRGGVKDRVDDSWCHADAMSVIALNRHAHDLGPAQLRALSRSLAPLSRNHFQ